MPPIQAPQIPSEAESLPQSPANHYSRYTLTQQVQYLTLLAEGYSGRDSTQRTGVIASAQIKIKNKAHERGFHPQEDPHIYE